MRVPIRRIDWRAAKSEGAVSIQMKIFRRSPPRPFIVAVSTALAGLIILADSIAEEKGKDADEKPAPSPEDLAWMSELTSGPPGPHAELKPVAVHFLLSWNNVFNAGELALSLDHQPGETGNSDEVLAGTAKGRSSGLARVLWPYEVEANATADPGTLRPHLFELSEKERSKSVDYQLNFQPGKLFSDSTVLPKKEGDEAETKRRIYGFDRIYDIFTAALYVRSFDLAKGESVSALVSPFKRPYHAEFTLVGKETRKVRGEKYDTLKFDVAIRKVNHDKTLQTYDKMKKVTIWVSDDEYRLPLEVRADIFIGFVSARMTERAWIADDGSKGESEVARKQNGSLSRFLENTRKTRLGKIPATGEANAE
jgi:hypothetical protein